MKRCPCLLLASGAPFSCVTFACVSEHIDMVLQAAPFESTSGMLAILSLLRDNLLDYAIASGCTQSQLRLIPTCLSPCMIFMVCIVLLALRTK